MLGCLVLLDGVKVTSVGLADGSLDLCVGLTEGEAVCPVGDMLDASALIDGSDLDRAPPLPLRLPLPRLPF